MHRAHQPLLPATNRYLQEKWDKATYQEHRRKVELAAPVVNTSTLPTPFHLQVNLKKIQLERERQAAWDRDNLHHYAKLWGIKQSQGRVDNWNFYPGHSLNWEKRRQDLAHICWENQQLVKRLEGRKSELAQEHWQQHWHKEQQIRNIIARYPRGTASCQASKEGWRQRTGGSSIPTSAPGRSPSVSPGRTRAPCSRRKNSVMGNSFWGSGSESTEEGEASSATASSPFPLRKRDVIQPPGAVVQRPSKGALGLAKIVPGSFSRRDTDEDGLLVRPNLPGGDSLEKPQADTAMAATQPHASSCSRENLRPSKNRLMPASRDMEKKPELSAAKSTRVSCRRTEWAPRFDGQTIRWTSRSFKSWKPAPQKSPEPPERGCGNSHPTSPC